MHNLEPHSVTRKPEFYKGPTVHGFTGLLFACLLLDLLLTVALRAAEPSISPRMLELKLQRRDATSGVVSVTTERVASTNVAIVMIDFWNYHWCATWVGRAGVMIPRMNQALIEARKLGMTVVHAPTDCASGHAGTPQREVMAGLPPCPLPKPSDFNPPAPWGLGFGGGCMCGGPYPCAPNYGWTREDPRLLIADTDFVSSGPRELNNLCVARNIKHIIYCGGAANMCLLQKQEAMLAMIRLGYHGIVARDITEAHSEFTAPGSADRATEQSVEYVEKLIGPSIHLVEELRKADCWDERALVDAPILVPWGFKMRPKFFDTTLAVNLSIPAFPASKFVTRPTVLNQTRNRRFTPTRSPCTAPRRCAARRFATGKRSDWRAKDILSACRQNRRRLIFSSPTSSPSRSTWRSGASGTPRRHVRTRARIALTTAAPFAFGALTTRREWDCVRHPT